jgi:phosphopantothenoylcysteine synthetase/decarboxylase
MDSQMFEQPAVQGHLETLAARGVHIVGPEAGRLASGHELVAIQSAADGPAIKVGANVWATWRTEDVRILPGGGERNERNDHGQAHR